MRPNFDFPDAVPEQIDERAMVDRYAFGTSSRSRCEHQIGRITRGERGVRIAVSRLSRCHGIERQASGRQALEQVGELVFCYDDRNFRIVQDELQTIERVGWIERDMEER